MIFLNCIEYRCTSWNSYLTIFHRDITIQMIDIFFWLIYAGKLLSFVRRVDNHNHVFFWLFINKCGHLN